MKIKPSERRAIRREYAAYQARFSDTSNEAYFRNHAAAFGCDPQDKAQCRAFCRMADAIAKDRRKAIEDVGFIPQAFILAKIRHPSKNTDEALSALWRKFLTLIDRAEKGSASISEAAYSQAFAYLRSVGRLRATSLAGVVIKLRAEAWIAWTANNQDDNHPDAIRLRALLADAERIAKRGGGA